MPPSEPQNERDQQPASGEKGESRTNQRRASAAALLDAFARQYERDRETNRASEKHRTIREYITIGGLFLAALVAIFQWWELRSTDHNIAQQAKIAAAQLEEMRTTGKQTDNLIAATKQSAEAAKLASSAALESNAAVRAQLKASVIIPDEPDSIIRVGENGGISVDLYLVNTGQSWARDVYANIEVIIKNGQQRIYFAPPIWFGGIDISQTTPFHHTFTDFQPLITGQIKNDDLLTVEITIGVSYFDIFDEKTLRYFRVKGWGVGDVNSPCCTLKEFQGGLGFQRQADMSRVPPLPPR